jgi:putative peptidoglycan lipid II flippase
MTSVGTPQRQFTPLTVPRILGFIGSIIALRLLLKVFGFGEKAVFAYYFDLGALDALTVALSAPLMILFTVRSVVNPTILPMFLQRLRSNDEAGAWGQIHAWLVLGLLVIGIVCVAGALCADALSRILAPGFSEEKHILLASLLRITIPSGFFLGLQPLFDSILNAQRRFAYPPLAELIVKVFAIAAIIVFAKEFGLLAAAVGTAAGILAGVALSLWGIRKEWHFRGARPNYRDPEFRAVLFLMCAPGLGDLASRIGTLVENAACSTLTPGSVAGLELARKLINMPLLIIPLASGTVLFTAFVEYGKSEGTEGATRLLGQAVRTMLFVFAPITVLTAILADPIVSIAYERGAFDEQAAILVSRILMWLTPTMALLSVEMLVMRYFFSIQMLWAPILIGVLCVALRVTFIAGAVEAWGLVAIVGAIVASRLLKVVGLVILATRRGGLPVSSWCLPDLLRLVPASVISGIAAYAVLHGLGPYCAHSLWFQLILLCASGGIGLMTYGFSTLLLQCPEWAYIRSDMNWREKWLGLST